ncbi:MAG: hypothetical protein AAGF95_10240 [Chloroflexota bacterium]
MNGQIRRIFQYISPYHMIGTSIGGSLLIGILLWLKQPLAALLVPFIILLLVLQFLWQGRLRNLAQQLRYHQSLQKFEIPRGEWGNVYRALNNVTQARRVQQRVHSRLMPSLPADAVAMLMDEGNGGHASDVRNVVVLSIRYTASKQQREDLQSSFDRWREFVCLVQQFGQQYNALIQPCGDGYLLVFGGFQNQPIGSLLQTVIQVAEELQQRWSQDQMSYAMPLHMYLTSGSVLIATVPGVGCCVFGPAVQQMSSVDDWIPCGSDSQLMCCVDTYRLLQQAHPMFSEYNALAIAMGSSQPHTIEMVTPTTQLM